MKFLALFVLQMQIFAAFDLQRKKNMNRAYAAWYTTHTTTNCMQ